MAIRRSSIPRKLFPFLFFIPLSPCSLLVRAVCKSSFYHDRAFDTFFLHLTPDIIRIRDGTVEVVGIGRTAAAAVKSGKAIPTFIFRIDIAKLELVADCRVGHARIHVAEQEIFVSYKLMHG